MFHASFSRYYYYYASSYLEITEIIDETIMQSGYRFYWRGESLTIFSFIQEVVELLMELL